MECDFTRLAIELPDSNKKRDAGRGVHILDLGHYRTVPTIGWLGS